MYRHIRINRLLSIKYYTDVPVGIFKRFSLPANDNLMRQGDLFKATYMSIKEKGVLDPVFCYDLVDVDLDNPPIYKNRKMYGTYLMRGNIRWLCCKDLGIPTINAIIVKVSHGQTSKNLFRGTLFTYSKVRTLKTVQDINECYKGYNPTAKILSNNIELKVPSLSSVDAFGVADIKVAIEKYNLLTPSTIDYAQMQRTLEK